jgi:hypothetical protein
MVYSILRTLMSSNELRGDNKRTCVLIASLFAAIVMAGGAFAQDVPIIKIDPNSARYAVGKGVSRETAAAMAVSPLLAKPLTTWNGSFSLNSTNYPFTMVGTDPSLGSQTTKVKTILVPVFFKISGGFKFNPNKKVSCNGNKSAVALVKNSPIFKSLDYNLDGTDVGITQYTDAFQRANFWSTVSGSAPDYHVLLKPVVAVPVIVKPPVAFVSLQACGPVGLVDINWFDGVEVPKLLKRVPGIKPNMLPIFLAYDVVFYQGDPNNCCIIGYHNATVTTKGVQTYSEAGFIDSGVFTGLDDVVALGHEVAEWLDDPFVNNNTPPWGNIGQVVGCQGNLEVGDPLSGTEVSEVGSNGFTYHVQDLAFVPWFAEAQTSFSVNGWFSFFGTFRSSAAPCS